VFCINDIYVSGLFPYKLNEKKERKVIHP